MIIRPLVDVFTGVYLFRRIVAMRRSIGIVVGMSVIAHSIGFFHVDSSKFIISELFSMTNFIFYWIIASIFSFLLLITSNTFSVKLLWKNWKRLQLGVYGMFYLACLHIAFIRFPRIDYWTLFVGLGIFLFRIYVWKKTENPKSKIAQVYPEKNINVMHVDIYIMKILEIQMVEFYHEQDLRIFQNHGNVQYVE